jgi:hypothetical protein
MEGGDMAEAGMAGPGCRPHVYTPHTHTAESASRILIILVIMTMQFGRINAFNEMCAGFKVK